VVTSPVEPFYGVRLTSYVLSKTEKGRREKKGKDEERVGSGDGDI